MDVNEDPLFDDRCFVRSFGLKNVPFFTKGEEILFSEYFGQCNVPGLFYSRYSFRFVGP